MTAKTPLSKRELELTRLSLTNKAMKMFPNSPKQLKVREEILKLTELINLKIQKL